MAPNLSSNLEKKSRVQNSNKNELQSSFPGVFYSGKRGAPFPNIFDWLAGWDGSSRCHDLVLIYLSPVKRRDDNIGNLWRVHGKLYNLEDFIKKHPGGSDWIKFTQGTDITEAFESSHIVGYRKIEKLLEKYYVKDIEEPRNSPYTFKSNGFYKTLKRKVEPILRNVGTGYSRQVLLIEDGLCISYLILALFSVWMGSKILQMLAGLILGMLIVGAHNFFHKKDNFRRYYMDLSPLSSFEWRISHAYSHHLFPNTILDFEIMLSEPLVEMLPSRPKNFVQKYLAIFYIEPLYFLYGPSQVIVRILSIVQRKQDLRWENFLIFLELFIFLAIAPSYESGFYAWMIIFMWASFWFIFVSNNSSHHHPIIFHDGDEARPDPDFGLCQLDATRGKSDWYNKFQIFGAFLTMITPFPLHRYHKPLFSVLTTFGEHPCHHLFPTICHSKLKFIKPALDETLREFSENYPNLTQFELFIGTHRQIYRTTTKK